MEMFRRGNEEREREGGKRGGGGDNKGVRENEGAREMGNKMEIDCIYLHGFMIGSILFISSFQVTTWTLLPIPLLKKNFKNFY